MIFENYNICPYCGIEVREEFGDKVYIDEMGKLFHYDCYFEMIGKKVA